jgi:hypothetical protein
MVSLDAKLKYFKQIEKQIKFIILVNYDADIIKVVAKINKLLKVQNDKVPFRVSIEYIKDHNMITLNLYDGTSFRFIGSKKLFTTDISITSIIRKHKLRIIFYGLNKAKQLIN